MSEVLKMSRKAFTVGVVATTIAWSIGLSALLAPLSAGAVAANTLVKASLPAVYYVGSDGKRYVFPNEKTYKTWYADFSSVQTITDAELAALAIGGNVTYKPGVKMVKITTDPKVYAVDAHGTLRWVSSEAVAVALYGASWNQMIHDVPDAFFTNYTLGSDITAASQFSPSGVSAAASSISVDKNLSTSGTVTGALTVSLSSSQPAGGTLPGGATSVNFLKFDIKNGSSAAMVVDSLTVRRSGAGQTGDFANVYIYEGNNRLTTGRNLNVSTHEASFGGLNLSIDAGATKSLWIAADMNAAQGAGNVHSLSVVDLRSGVNIASGLPAAGPYYTMATADVGTVQINRAGATPLANVKAGGLAQKIGEFQLTAGANEDVNFTKISLFRGGAVTRSNVSNLVLKQNGVTQASAAGYDANDRAAFVLSTPMKIERGSSKTFDVFADIAASSRVGAAETIFTYLDQTTDLLAVGATYGYGVQVASNVAPVYDGTTGGACALGGPWTCNATRIEGGQLTTTFNGPAAKDIGSNSKDVELYNFTLAAQSNLEIRNVRLAISSVGGDADADRGDLWDDNGDGAIDGDEVGNFTDIKIVDTATGAIVAGPVELATPYTAANDLTQNLLFNSVFTLSAGQSRTFKVTADIANNTNVDFLADQARMDLRWDLLGGNDIRNLDNSTWLAAADLVPNGAINGNPMTVRAPSLTIAAASTPVAQTYIQGSQGIALMGITLQAGDAADVRVSQVTIAGQVDDVPGSGWAYGVEAGNSVAGIVQTAKLWNGATQLGDTETPTAGAGGVLTFDNLNLTVPKGSTLTLSLTGNLASALAGLPNSVRFVVRDQALDGFADGWSATDPDGNTVNVICAAADPSVIGPTMNIAAAGTMTVVLAPDDTESEASAVIGGSSNAVLAKYKFTALNEELKLTKVRVSVAVANTVSTLSLYDGSTLVGGPVSVNGAGNADFSSVNFVIPKDGSKVLTVKGALNTVGSSGATSGTAASVRLHDGDIVAGVDSTFEVRGTGTGSSTLIRQTDAVNDADGADADAFDDGDLQARAKVVRKSKPTVSLVTLPSTTLATGTVAVMRFTVAADAGGDVALKHLGATLNESVAAAGVLLGLSCDANADGDCADGGEAMTSSVRRVGDSTDLPGTASLRDTTDVGCAGDENICAFSTEFTTEEVIAAGTSRSYDIRFVITGAVAANDSISTNLTGDTVPATGELDNTAAPATTIDDLVADPDGSGLDPAAYNFIWSDMSAQAHGDVKSAGAANGVDDAAVGVTNDWTNGLFVKVLPTDSQTMSK
jgi:hypothetical protein